MRTEASKDRLAVQAGLWYVVSSVLIRLVSLITTPLFTRLLSTQQYGAAGTFQSWCSLLTTVFSLNLMSSVGRAKLDFPGRLDDYIGSVSVLSLLVSLALSLGAVLFLGPVSAFLELNERETLLLLCYLCFFPALSFAQAGLRYRYRYRENIAVQWYLALGPALLSLGLILFSPLDKGFSRMVGLTAPIVLLSLVVWARALPGGLRMKQEYWRYGLSLSLPMMLHALSMSLLAQSDKLVIARFGGQTEVAYYHLVRNYALLLFLLFDTVSQAWLPWFHDSLQEGRRDEVRRMVRLISALSCLGGLFLIALGPEAVLLLGGSAYAPALSAVAPTVMGVVCQCLYAHYINLVLHEKKTRYVSFGTMAAALLNLGLNFLFVPRYGFSAAAYTTFASFLCLLLIHFLFVRKKLNIRLYDDRQILFSAGVTAVIAACLSLLYGSLLARLGVLLVCFCGVLYGFRAELQSLISLLQEHMKKKRAKRRPQE